MSAEATLAGSCASTHHMIGTGVHWKIQPKMLPTAQQPQTTMIDQQAILNGRCTKIRLSNSKTETLYIARVQSQKMLPKNHHSLKSSCCQRARAR